MSLAVLVAACSSKTEDVKVEESVPKIELGKEYGPEKVNPETAISVEEMLSEFHSNQENSEFTFKADLAEVCSKAGCWVNIDKGNGETFMVRFKDHFTIPTETEVGTSAYLHGTAYLDTISVELLQHFAEDAGKSPEEIALITEPKFELGFEADGIVLEK